MTHTDSALSWIARPGDITLGIELPLDNDWSPERDVRRKADGRLYGVLDLTHYADLACRIWRERYDLH